MKTKTRKTLLESFVLRTLFFCPHESGWN